MTKLIAKKHLFISVLLIGLTTIALALLIHGYYYRTLEASPADGTPFAAGPLKGIIHNYPETLTGTALLHGSRLNSIGKGWVSWVVNLDLKSRTAKYAGEWDGLFYSVSPRGQKAVRWERSETTGVLTIIVSDLHTSGPQYRWQTDAIRWVDTFDIELFRRFACITEKHVVGISSNGDAYILFSHDGLSSKTMPFQTYHDVSVPPPEALVADGNAEDSVFLIPEPHWLPGGLTLLPGNLWHFDFQSEKLMQKPAKGLSLDSHGAKIQASHYAVMVNRVLDLTMTMRRKNSFGNVEIRGENMIFTGMSSTGRWGIIWAYPSDRFGGKEKSNDVEGEQLSVFDTLTNSVYPVITLMNNYAPECALVVD